MLNPSRYRIFTIGKVRKRWIQDGISLYQRRLPGLQIIELRASNSRNEAYAIYSAQKKDEKLIVLTEEGKFLTSTDFAKYLQELKSQRLAFVIGGTDGLSPEIKDSAYCLLSLSPLTFPHEIARLLLIEQLYRAQTILQGSPYHRS